jgi:hypothetical protein
MKLYIRTGERLRMGQLEGDIRLAFQISMTCSRDDQAHTIYVNIALLHELPQAGQPIGCVYGGHLVANVERIMSFGEEQE